MNKKIAILGSTGSIGKTTLNSISSDKRFKVQILAANKNAKKLLEQAISFNVKDVFIQDLKIYNIYKIKFKKKKIRLHHDLKNINIIRSINVFNKTLTPLLSLCALLSHNIYIIILH